MSDELVKSKPSKAVVVDGLAGLMELARMENPPEVVEFRAPADAEFPGGSAGFIEKVNELKHALGEKGFHCRISQETVVENVWLFRYLPRSRPVAEIKAEQAEAREKREAAEKDESDVVDVVTVKAGDVVIPGKPPLLIPADIDEPVNTKLGHKLPLRRDFLNYGKGFGPKDFPINPNPWEKTSSDDKRIRGGTTDNLWVDAPPPSLWERLVSWLKR